MSKKKAAVLEKAAAKAALIDAAAQFSGLPKESSRKAVFRASIRALAAVKKHQPKMDVSDDLWFSLDGHAIVATAFWWWLSASEVLELDELEPYSFGGDWTLGFAMAVAATEMIATLDVLEECEPTGGEDVAQKLYGGQEN